MSNRVVTSSVSASERDEIAMALEKLLGSQSVGVVLDWVVGGRIGAYGVKVQLTDGRQFEAHGTTVAKAIDALVVALARRQH